MFMLLVILLRFKTVMIDAQTGIDVYEKVLRKINPGGKEKFHDCPEWETRTGRHKEPDRGYLPVASRVAKRCGRLAAMIFSCATRRL